MAWFKVDDGFSGHRKVAALRRGAERLRAVGLWTLAGAWSAEQGLDGLVPDYLIDELGATQKDVDALVRVGLWERVDADAVFHDWDHYQPDAASLRAQKAKESHSGSLGNHVRWHVKKNVVVPDCEFCHRPPDQEPDWESDRVGIGSTSPVPVPGPVSLVTAVSQSLADRLTADGLDRIRRLTNGTAAHARRCVEVVLAKAPGDVRNPAAYVIAAINDDPEPFRFKRGNPTKDTECPTHAGWWADACAGCAADRKAAS